MRTAQIGLLFLMLLTSLSVSAGKIYKVVDEKTGRITFTDKPSSAPKQDVVDPVILPAVNTQPAIKIPEPEPEQQSLAPGYRSVAIVQPKDQSTIPSGQRNLIIQLKIEPQLRDSHRVQFYYDNMKRGAPIPSSSFEINELFRGAHNISADIVDKNGVVLSSSQTITVYVHRPSIR